MHRDVARFVDGLAVDGSVALGPFKVKVEEQRKLALTRERALAGLVIELVEPYRSTILLRFFEGLSAAEIAHREGVPPGTVRWRLKRGLDQLRAELDRSHAGSRQAWQLALAPLGAGAPDGGAATALSAPAAMPAAMPAATPAALKGVPIMKTLLSASAVVAGLAGGALLMSPSARPKPPAAACAPAVPHAAAVSRPVPAPAQKLDAMQRQLLLQRIVTAQRRPGGSATATPAPPLDAAYIRAQIQTLLPLLKECYENTHRSHGGARGKLVVDFTIVGEPERPLGFRKIVPQPTFVVDPATGEIASVHTPERTMGRPATYIVM